MGKTRHSLITTLDTQTKESLYARYGGRIWCGQIVTNGGPRRNTNGFVSGGFRGVSTDLVKNKSEWSWRVYAMHMVLN